MGVVTGEAAPFTRHVAWPGSTSTAHYEHASEADDPDAEEWVVPVRWLRTVRQDEAVWERGLFANQNSACRMGSRFTVETLVDRFDAGRDRPMTVMLVDPAPTRPS